MVAIITLHHRRHGGAASAALRTFAKATALMALAVLRAPSRLHHNRQVTRTLGQMSEHQLRDIGLCRQDVIDSAAQAHVAEVGRFWPGAWPNGAARRLA